MAAFGFAFIVGHSKISLPVRQRLDPGVPLRGWGDALRVLFLVLIECPACIGFWFGAIAQLAALLTGHSGFFQSVPAAFSVVLTGCATSGSNFILARISRLGEETNE